MTKKTFQRRMGQTIYLICLFYLGFVVGQMLCQHCEIDTTVKIVKLAGHYISISEPYPTNFPIPLPLETYYMTPAKYYEWATTQNANSQQEWENWYKTAPPRWINYDVMDYNQQREGTFFGDQRENGSMRIYQKRFLNPDYQTRPRTIFNPYCPPCYDWPQN